MRIALLLLLAAPAAAAPRLGVVLVVDQMRADFLERAHERGFARLKREGAVFADAHHRHLPTETAPGHASIASGRPPSIHGIVGNEWYDPALREEIYCLEDAAFGVGPGRLEGATLGDALEAADPRSRVFSISAKDRAAVLMGGRKAELALWLDRKTGLFTTSPHYRRPAWLDAFNERLRASRRLAVVNGKVPSPVMGSPALDEATSELVSELVRREGVGRGPGTDLLFVSFSATDYVGHAFGLGKAMDAQLRSLDRIVGEKLAEWEKASGGELALALTGDHGAIPAPEDDAKVTRIQREDFEDAFEAALQKLWPAPGEKWVLFVSEPHVTLSRGLAASKGLEWTEVLREAARAFESAPGVRAAWSSEQIPALRSDDALASTLRRSYYPGRSGDVFVVFKENVLVQYDFNSRVEGTSHGTPYRYDAHVPLVFWGKGVKPGRHDAPASPQDIAPTMARLLGFDYPAIHGAALRAEALTR